AFPPPGPRSPPGPAGRPCNCSPSTALRYRRSPPPVERRPPPFASIPTARPAMHLRALLTLLFLPVYAALLGAASPDADVYEIGDAFEPFSTKDQHDKDARVSPKTGI